MKCSNCLKELLGGSQQKFCSKSCAAKFNNAKRSPESRAQQRLTLLKTVAAGNIKKRSLPSLTIYSCLVCGKEYACRGTSKIRKSCSRTCNKEYQSRIYKPAIRGKRISYNGINLQSSWELEIAKFLDDNQIQWIRPTGLEWIDSNQQKRRFYPDFFLPEYNIYLDPKNPQVIARDKEKLDYFSEKIELYYGEVNYLKDIVLKAKGP